MTRSGASRVRRPATLLAVTAVIGCGNVGSRTPADGSPDAAALGTEANPARTCTELRVAGMPSGAYWVRPASGSPPFEVYCEQEINGGGWAMVANSVRRDDGKTAVFWQFNYGDRLKQLGTRAPDQNFYNGSLYLTGTEYMDIFVDLADKTAVAAVMTASGFNPATMQFMNPALTIGNSDVFQHQFSQGWSAQDFDGDPYQPVNCAAAYGNIAQHYGGCWVYNFGADADPPVIDGGVGPHVWNTVLTALGLALQPGDGTYSQVKRIARFTRW